jgi:hypothetical protein
MRRHHLRRKADKNTDARKQSPAQQPSKAGASRRRRRARTGAMPVARRVDLIGRKRQGPVVHHHLRHQGGGRPRSVQAGGAKIRNRSPAAVMCRVSHARIPTDGDAETAQSREPSMLASTGSRKNCRQSAEMVRRLIGPAASRATKRRTCLDPSINNRSAQDWYGSCNSSSCRRTRIGQ